MDILKNNKIACCKIETIIKIYCAKSFVKIVYCLKMTHSSGAIPCKCFCCCIIQCFLLIKNVFKFKEIISPLSSSGVSSPNILFVASDVCTTNDESRIENKSKTIFTFVRFIVMFSVKLLCTEILKKLFPWCVKFLI